jgi:hypothetical protein
MAVMNLFGGKQPLAYDEEDDDLYDDGWLE